MKVTDPLIIEAIEHLIETGDLWRRRKIYAMEKLIMIKEQYIEEAPSDLILRDTIIKELRNDIKRMKKQIRVLKK